MSHQPADAQPWKFIAVTDPALLKMIADAASEKLSGMNTFVAQAPAIIAVSGKDQTSHPG